MNTNIHLPEIQNAAPASLTNSKKVVFVKDLNEEQRKEVLAIFNSFTSSCRKIGCICNSSRSGVSEPTTAHANKIILGFKKLQDRLNPERPQTETTNKIDLLAMPTLAIRLKVYENSIEFSQKAILINTENEILGIFIELSKTLDTLYNARQEYLNLSSENTLSYQSPLTPEFFIFVISKMKNWLNKAEDNCNSNSSELMEEIKKYCEDQDEMICKFAKLFYNSLANDFHYRQWKNHYLKMHQLMINFLEQHPSTLRKVDVLCPVLIRTIDLFTQDRKRELNSVGPKPKSQFDDLAFGLELQESEYYREINTWISELKTPTVNPTKKHVYVKAPKKSPKKKTSMGGNSANGKISTEDASSSLKETHESSKTQSVEISPTDLFISDIHKQPALKTAPRIKRWDKVDPENPKQLMSKFIDGGTLSYADLSEQQMSKQHRYHSAAQSVEKLLNSPNGTDYKVLTNTGYGCYAILRTEDSAEFGVIRYGFGVKDQTLCIHKKFDPLNLLHLLKIKSSEHMDLSKTLANDENKKDDFYDVNAEGDLVRWGNWEEKVYFDESTRVVTIEMRKPDNAKVFMSWEILPHASKPKEQS